MKTFDVIIPVGGADINFVPRVVDFIDRCLEGVSNIFILTSPQIKLKLEKKNEMSRCTILDENVLVEGLDFASVKNLLEECSPTKPLRVGWYYQQLLKLGFARSSYCGEYYLSWDADTLPLAPLSFFDDKHILFNPKNEYNPNYFKTIKRLLGFDKVASFSFISENMMFVKDYVNEMITEIESSNNRGRNWIEKILYACDFTTPFPEFSEFETYGTFCIMRHPGVYYPRHLNTFREANMICGRCISEKRLRILSFDVDIVSFEKVHVPLFPYNLPYIYERMLHILAMSPFKLAKKVKEKLTHKESSENIESILYRLPAKKI